MTRKHFAVAIIAAALVAALASAGAALSGSTATRTLKGVVGPGYSITLKLNGKTVKKLKAGKYKIVVTDKSPIHNFTLERERPSRPKLEKDLTSVGFTGTKTVTLRVTDSGGSVRTVSHDVTVSNRSPVASFGMSATDVDELSSLVNPKTAVTVVP